MNKFKVGDRVVVYAGENKYKGTVTSCWNECLGVNTGNRNNVSAVVHHKQCRKLKPKVKTGRRFRGEWKRMYLCQDAPSTQLCFVPLNAFADLLGLDGENDNLIQEKK